MTILVQVQSNTVKIVRCKSSYKRAKGSYVRDFDNGDLPKAIEEAAGRLKSLKIRNKEAIQVDGLPEKVIDQVLRKAGIR